MADLLLSYAANEILKKMQSVVTDQITRAWGLEDDLEKLMDSMGRLQSLLQKAQYMLAAGDDESIKRWLDKLQKVIYAAADVLDLFHYEILRREVEVKNQLKRKVREFVSRNNPILLRVKMAAKVKEVSESLADMEKQAPAVLLTMTLSAITDGAERGFVQDNQPDRRTHPYLETRAVGRTDELEAIMEMLQATSSDSPRLTVVTIVGFGGIGKTTLAKLVSKVAEEKKLFDEFMWVCVSETFDYGKILEQMLQKTQATGGMQDNITALVNHLKQKLKDKSFFLVLDDVWNEEIEKWQNLKVCLENICGKNGNFVMVTTRITVIPSIMNSEHIVPLNQLSDTECWSIIKERVLGNERESVAPNMETIGMAIAKKCGGVPLAAMVVGGVMSSRKNETEWLSIQHSNVWNEVDKNKKILGVLKLSFDHLPLPQKLCFAYCSLFPKNFVFEKAKLIQLWMAEDFLEKTLTNGGRRPELMEDVGEEYFHGLLVNSFFQDAEEDDCGNIIACKMHDLLHDLALSISKSQKLQCGSDCIQTSDGCRWNFSCDRKSEVQEILQSSKDKTGNIRCLLCRVDVSPMLSNFKRLRSLDISDAKLKNLPHAIRKLKHLRYLDISENENIQVLPESITKLYHLQTLRVFQCTSLKELPSKIANLVSLRHIGFDDKRLMPLKVGDLTNLQTLPFFVVGLQEGQMINELEGLKEIRGELVVCDLENVRGKGEAERAKMKEKKLSKLVLQWMKVKQSDVEYFSSSRESNHEEVMEGIGAPTNTQSLTAEWYMGKQFPKWMSELMELVNLTLKNCRRCVTMPTVGHLPNLKILRVERMDSMKAIGSEFYGESNNVETLFPLLEEFSIRKMKSLVEWVAPKGTKIFPKLRQLFISDCPNLTNFPLSQSTSSTISMRLSGSFMDRGAIVEILCFMDFKSLEDMWIQSCPKLTFLHIGLTSLMNFSLSLEDFISGQDENLVKNLSDCSNELGEYRSWMRIDGAIEIIREFPKSLGALEIERFDKLSVEAFHGLSCLKHLEISFCNSLESIPNLSSLTSLKHLKIRYCSSLESIPSPSSFSSLKHLEIRFCSNLKSISNPSSLTSLKYLEISDCSSLESIPNLSFSTSLKYLEISYCSSLVSIPSLLSLTSLKHLEIRVCDRVESIPSLSSLISLKYVAISGRSCLESIQSLSSLTSLEYLRITCSSLLEAIPNLSCLTSLKHLRISHQFDQLESIPTTCLEKLHIWNCDNLTSLPAEIKLCTSLEELTVVNCGGMESIDDDVIGSLAQLKELEWGGFSQELDQLPGLNLIRLLNSLQKLKIIGWEKLTSLPYQLQHLASITHLEIQCFDGVESLPDWFCELSSLQTLFITCCKNLKNLTKGMQRLSQLRSLDILECPLLKERCAKDAGPEWSNISHIPRIQIDYEDIQDVRCETNAEYLVRGGEGCS